jgi:hypothetical protein
MHLISVRNSFISISDMKNRIIPLLLGFFAAALLAELLLHALPVSTGYNLGGVDADHPISRGAAYSRYTYSRDWSFHLDNSGVLNNYGFRAAHDYAPEPRALIVVGNSFIQADAVAPPETITERLAARLQRPAYGVGVDGFSLADYLEAARWASAQFDARNFLVLLTTGDLTHSCMPRAGEHHLRFADGEISMALVERAPPSRLKRWLNHSMLFRYLYDNLHAAANWSKGWRRQDDAPWNPQALHAVLGCTDDAFETAATRYLLSGFREIESSHHARVIFLLAPGYRREQLVDAGGVRDVDVFAQHAALEGFTVVHLDQPFAAALNSGVRLDYWPIDGHWNATAHAIAAEVAATALSGHLSSGTPP